MDFLIGIPSRSYIGANFDDAIGSWINGQKVAKTKAVSNRIDWNRTIIWNQAKKLDTSLIMLDTDVYPITPYEETKQYIIEDFADGYDVVFAPLLSHGGNLLFSAENYDDYVKETPYDAHHSGFGFVAFSKRLIRTLEPLTHLDVIEESLEMMDKDNKIPEEVREEILSLITKEYGEPQPIVYDSLQKSLPEYFTYTSQLSEDSQFCRRMRRKGIKMAIDPRIKAQHMTEVPFTFTVEGVKKGMEAQKKQREQALQDARKKRLDELKGE